MLQPRAFGILNCIDPLVSASNLYVVYQWKKSCEASLLKEHVTGPLHHVHVCLPLIHIPDVPLGGVLSPRKRQDSYRLLSDQGEETKEEVLEGLVGDATSVDSYALAMEAGGYVCVYVYVCQCQSILIVGCADKLYSLMPII